MGAEQSKPATTNDQNQGQTTATTTDTTKTTTTTSMSSKGKEEASAGATNNNNSSSGGEGSGCPMHRADGSYSWDWTALWKPEFPHGPGGSRPLDPKQVEQHQQKQAQQKKQAEEAGTKSGGGSSSGCPVKHNNNNNNNGSSLEFNVYGQPIDPNNKMPVASAANQLLPAPGQTVPLSTERVASSIPKGSLGGAGNNNSDAAASSTTWTYPSPQQFYNALARKGKVQPKDKDDDVDTEEEVKMMESVVALHNHMNEKTWRKVVEWENVIHPPSSNSYPKLLKFQGRPTDLSPKATLKHYLFGHPLPYDRHDWVVLRDNGQTVRYVIDYYYDETRAQQTEQSARPALHQPGGSDSLLVDVRPALDDPMLAFHRMVTMPLAVHWKQNTSFQPLPLQPTPNMKSQVSESVQVWQNNIRQGRHQKDDNASDAEESAPVKISKSEAQVLVADFASMMQACKQQQLAVDRCNEETACARASMDLTVCMAQWICPLQHAALLTTLEGGGGPQKKGTGGDDDDELVEAALLRMNECVMMKTQQHAYAKQTYPDLL